MFRTGANRCIERPSSLDEGFLLEKRRCDTCSKKEATEKQLQDIVDKIKVMGWNPT